MPYADDFSVYESEKLARRCGTVRFPFGTPAQCASFLSSRVDLVVPAHSTECVAAGGSACGTEVAGSTEFQYVEVLADPIVGPPDQGELG